MADEQLISAVRALASIAEGYADQPWTVYWLRAHAERIGAGSTEALGELRDRLADLEHDLVVEHEDQRARRIIEVLQTRLAGTPRPRGTGSPASTRPAYAAPRRESRNGLIAGVFGVVLVGLGIASVLAGADCGSSRRSAGAVLALAGGALGVITIALRTLELRRQHGPGADIPGDLALLIGVAQILSLAITWFLLHGQGCTVLGR